jgi:hypothetical protein
MGHLVGAFVQLPVRKPVVSESHGHAVGRPFDLGLE